MVLHCELLGTINGRGDHDRAVFIANDTSKGRGEIDIGG